MNPRVFHVSPRFGLRGWASLVIALLLLAAILFAVTVVAVGILVFLLPAFAIGTAMYYLRRKRPPRQQGPTVIDGEYRVIDTGAEERADR